MEYLSDDIIRNAREELKMEQVFFFNYRKFQTYAKVERIEW